LDEGHHNNEFNPNGEEYGDNSQGYDDQTSDVERLNSPSMTS